MATQDSRKGRSTGRKPSKPKKTVAKPWRREPLKTSRTLCGFFPRLCEEHFEEIASTADGLLKGSYKDKPITFARGVKEQYEQWRTQVEDGHIELAMKTAFWMGMNFGLLCLEEGIPAIPRGKKQLADLARARDRRKITKVRPGVIEHEAIKIWKASPDKNITWVRRKTAKFLTEKLVGDQRVSYWTVMDHTKGLKLPRRQ
jgi:hypothetical protein